MERTLLQDCRVTIRRAGFRLAVALGTIFILCRPAGASGYEFDGVGARSVARGGAVIADAADWTGIYWNPAGLAGSGRGSAGLEVRGGGMRTKDGNSFNTPLGNPFDKTTADSSFIFGAAGAVVPFKDGSALGLGVYTPIMQGAKFSDTAAPPAAFFNSLDYKSNVVLAVGNVSYARKVTEKLQAGLGVDLIYGRLKTRAVSDFAAVPLPVFPFAGPPDVQTVEVDGSGYGLEGVAGLKYQQSADWSFGAVFRTGSGFRIKGDATAHSAGGLSPDEDSRFHILLKHPATSGVGAAWQAGPRLKLTCDFTQTWWRGFSNKTSYDKPGAMLSSSGNSLSWNNSVKFRAGALWSQNEKTDYMFGYAFDTFAIDRKSVDFSTAVDVPMHRFSAAVTRKWSALEATIGALAGSGRRKSDGIRYSLSGWYLMSELVYRF